MQVHVPSRVASLAPEVMVDELYKSKIRSFFVARITHHRTCFVFASFICTVLLQPICVLRIARAKPLQEGTAPRIGTGREKLMSPDSKARGYE